MPNNPVLDRLTIVLNKEREAYHSTAEMAAAVGVPYDALYALLTGNRARGVNLDLLTTLSHRFPAVAALFLPPESQICSCDDADSQGASA